MIPINFSNYQYKPILLVVRFRGKYRVVTGTLSGIYSQELLIYKDDCGRTSKVPKPNLKKGDVLIPIDKRVSLDELKQIKTNLERLIHDAGRRVYRYKN